MADEYWQDHFLPGYRSFAASRVRRCVARYRGHYKVKSFSCLDQYPCMAFAQLTYRESLRDIEAFLGAQQAKLYHMGIRGRVSRNTLATANELRDWRIHADFARLHRLTQAAAFFVVRARQRPVQKAHFPRHR